MAGTGAPSSARHWQSCPQAQPPCCDTRAIEPAQQAKPSWPAPCDSADAWDRKAAPQRHIAAPVQGHFSISPQQLALVGPPSESGPPQQPPGHAGASLLADAVTSQPQFGVGSPYTGAAAAASQTQTRATMD